MTREREQGSERDERRQRDGHDGAHGEPGKHTLTAGLTGPTGTIDSGLGGPIMRKARDDNGVAPDAESAVANAASSSGSSLPVTLQRKFEASLGTDLSSVRVHTGPESEAAASAVGAKAYAVGQDIHFGAGQYDPSSDGGQHLIAHEVAHTVQQRGASPSRQHKLEVSEPGDALEAEADQAAAAMVTGTPASVTSGSVAIARKGKKGAEDKEKDGKDKKKPKYPTWENETVDIPLGKLGSVKYDFKKGKGTIGKSGKAKAEHNFFEVDKNLQRQVWGPFGVDLGLEAKVGIAASAEGKIAGVWEPAVGPYAGEEDEMMMSLGAKGGGALTLGAEGAVKVGGFFGMQNVVNVAAGFSAGLECASKLQVTAGGTARRWPNGTGDGSIDFIVSGTAKFLAKGGIYVDFVALDDRTTLYTQELGEHELGSAEVTCKATWVPGGGVTADDPVVTATWNGLPQPQQKPKRPLTEAERKKHFPVEQGASGAPGHVPEDTDCTNDGAGGSAAECKVPEKDNTHVDDGVGGAPNDSGASGAGG